MTVSLIQAFNVLGDASSKKSLINQALSNLWVITVVGGIIVVVIGGVVLNRIQELRSKKQGLTILKASYGKNGKVIDITDKLNSLIKDGRLETILSNDLAGDPAGGMPKIGKIKYRYNGKVYVKEFVEMEAIILP